MSFAQVWTVSETANVGGQNYAHVYNTTLTSPSVITNPITVGWNDCLVLYNVGSASTSTSVSWVASPIALSTTTAGISGTLAAASLSTTNISRTTVSGPVRTLWGVATFPAGATDKVTLEIAQTKCSNR